MPRGGIALLVKDKRWCNAFPRLRAVATKVVGLVLDLKQTEVSLVFADDAFVQALNKQYCCKDKPTNVLSFPMDSVVAGIWMAGDIVLSFDTIYQEATLQHKTIEAHLAHLLVHGALHLKGFDHILESDALLMETTEIEILKNLGFNNPYQQREE